MRKAVIVTGMALSLLGACVPLAEKLHRQKMCEGLVSPVGSKQFAECIKADWG